MTRVGCLLGLRPAGTICHQHSELKWEAHHTSDCARGSFRKSSINGCRRCHGRRAVPPTARWWCYIKSDCRPLTAHSTGPDLQETFVVCLSVTTGTNWDTHTHIQQLGIQSASTVSLFVLLIYHFPTNYQSLCFTSNIIITRCSHLFWGIVFGNY